MNTNLLKGDLTSNQKVDEVFKTLETNLLDTRKLHINFSEVTSISAYFLEKLENLFLRARELGVEVKLNNITPEINKVLHVYNGKFKV